MEAGRGHAPDARVDWWCAGSKECRQLGRQRAVGAIHVSACTRSRSVGFLR